MPRLLILIVILLLIYTSASYASDLFGICMTGYWPDAPNRGVCLSEQKAKDIQELGVKWMRLEFMQKNGKVDLEAYDEIVDRAAKYGVRILGLVDYATIPSNGKEEWAEPAYEKKFAQEVQRLVKHFKGRIHCWEVWNEPNFYDFRLEPEDFGRILEHTYRAIKGADPSATVVLGGLAGPWSGPDDHSAKQYLEKVYESKAVKAFYATRKRWPFDVVGNHPYAWDQSPDSYLEKALRDNILSVMQKYGDAKKPIWLTEIGWDTDPNSSVKMGDNEAENLVKQAQWLIRLYDICKTAKRADGKTPLVERAFWFQYEFSGFSLRDGNWNKRPCWDAYKAAATGQPLTNTAAFTEAPQRENFFGVHLLLVGGQDIKKHVTWAHTLTGDGGYLKCFFMGIDNNTKGPNKDWVDLIEECYRQKMIPFIRLAGRHEGSGWIKPKADAPGDYTSIANAVKRVVEGLPRKDNVPVYFEIWNEPNLGLEWSGKASAKEYADFFVAVSKALKSIGDSRIKVVNGATALDSGFVEECCKANPEFINAFDYWASHPYPQNHPPEYNIDNGAKEHLSATIDGYKLETDVLKKYGRDSVKVFITETGWPLGNNSYPEYPVIDEVNRADYSLRAFRDWYPKFDEVMAVFPFEFCDAGNSGVWTTFDWVYPDSGTDERGWPTKYHLQYAYVASLAKPGCSWGSISGRITEETLGSPVRGVTVKAGDRSATTDRLGNYIISGLKPGSYRVILEKEGYDSAKNLQADVQAGRNIVGDLRIKALGKGTITGRVKDADNSAISQVNITLQPGGRKATTDSNGWYKIENVTPGWYVITASKEGLEPVEKRDFEVRRNEEAKADFIVAKEDEPGGPNMLTNPGMEQNENGVSLGWNTMDGKEHPEVFSKDTEVRHSGDASQKIVCGSPNDYVWQMTPYGSIVPGKKYAAQVWAKAHSVSENDPGATLAITFFSNSHEPKGTFVAEKTLNGITNWTLLRVEAVAPPGSERMQVILRGNARFGTVNFDDAYAGLIQEKETK